MAALNFLTQLFWYLIQGGDFGSAERLYVFEFLMIVGQSARHDQLDFGKFFIVVELDARALTTVSRSLVNISTSFAFSIFAWPWSTLHYFYLDLDTDSSLSEEDEEEERLRSRSLRSLSLSLYLYREYPFETLLLNYLRGSLLNYRGPLSFTGVYSINPS